MAGLFGFLAAGVAQGVGDGMVEEAKARREAALEEVRNGRLMQREQMDRDFRSSERVAGESFSAGQNELTRTSAAEQARLTREDAATRSSATLDAGGDMVVGADGKTYNRVGSKLVPITGLDGTPVDGVAKPKDDKAPEVKEFYDESGNEYKAQWDPKSRAWEKIGGSKAAGGGMSVTMADGTIVQMGGKALTEGQSKDTVYATRAEGALSTLDKFGNVLTGTIESAAAGIPKVGNYLKSDEYQQAEQSSREFLQAILRKDTGAAITEGEMESYGATYLPRPGDGEEVLKQKKVSRRRALEAIKAGLPPNAILAQEQTLLKTGMPEEGVTTDTTPGQETVIDGVRIRRLR